MTYGPVPIGLRLNAVVLRSWPLSACAGAMPIWSLSKNAGSGRSSVNSTVAASTARTDFSESSSVASGDAESGSSTAL